MLTGIGDASSQGSGPVSDPSDMSSSTFLTPSAYRSEDDKAVPLFSQLTKLPVSQSMEQPAKDKSVKRKAFTHRINKVLKDAGINLKKGSALKKPVFLGLPLWSVLTLGVMLSGTALIVAFGKKKREVVASNPRQATSHELEKAKKFREDFHWGYKSRKVVSKNFSKVPSAAVKLGDVEEITYRTRKRGEKAQLFQHAFEGKRPTLAMDIDNKRLHMVGGTYTVTADGITG